MSTFDALQPFLVTFWAKRLFTFFAIRMERHVMHFVIALALAVKTRLVHCFPPLRISVGRQAAARCKGIAPIAPGGVYSRLIRSARWERQQIV